LIKVDGLLEEEKKSYPGRVPWMPAWIGLFERALYCLLIGGNVDGGAAFIGVWVGIKLAGGWQVWSKGTTYGRAIFFSGLLGNAMSVIYGIVAGLVIKALIQA
jgi:tetrahydromethanopterin S-methyltransferase subunit B